MPSNRNRNRTHKPSASEEAETRRIEAAIRAARAARGAATPAAQAPANPSVYEQVVGFIKPHITRYLESPGSMGTGALDRAKEETRDEGGMRRRREKDIEEMSKGNAPPSNARRNTNSRRKY